MGSVSFFDFPLQEGGPRRPTPRREGEFFTGWCGDVQYLNHLHDPKKNPQITVKSSHTLHLFFGCEDDDLMTMKKRASSVKRWKTEPSSSNLFGIQRFQWSSPWNFVRRLEDWGWVNDDLSIYYRKDIAKSPMHAAHFLQHHFVQDIMGWMRWFEIQRKWTHIQPSLW